ncbi:MAG: carboxypeptidase-like regulatory domain-containing protein [Longimicrobiales bacterium]
MAARSRGPAVTLFFLLVAGLISGTRPAPAAAQLLSGRVISEDDGSPLQGAVVELLDTAGTEVIARLTGPDGRFSMRNVAPGRYRFRVGLLGYKTVTTNPFTLEAGQTLHRRLSVSLEPIRLEGIQVSRGGRCGGDFGGTDLVRLWEEARKGLKSVVLSETSPLVSFRIAVTDRDLDAVWKSVLTEEVRTRRAWGNDPFRSLSADTLLRHGFIRGGIDDTVTYYGPDANLLLSDPFIEQYCFGITKGDDGEVGLTFEPEARLRGTAQIEGVLWLDAESAALRRLEFTYTRSPVRGFEPGGDVVYEQLPNGAWFIRRWRLRMPRMALVNGLPTSRLGSIHETSGEVIEVLGLDHQLRPLDAAAPQADGAAQDGPPADERVGASGGPPPEEGRAFTTWVRAREQPRRHILHIRNDSDRAVHINAITLDQCTNIREWCGRYRKDVVLRPGEGVRIHTVHALNASEAVYFEWSYDATTL